MNKDEVIEKLLKSLSAQTGKEVEYKKEISLLEAELKHLQQKYNCLLITVKRIIDLLKNPWEK